MSVGGKDDQRVKAAMALLVAARVKEMWQVPLESESVVHKLGGWLMPIHLKLRAARTRNGIERAASSSVKEERARRDLPKQGPMSNGRAMILGDISKRMQESVELQNVQADMKVREYALVYRRTLGREDQTVQQGIKQADDALLQMAFRDVVENPVKEIPSVSFDLSRSLVSTLGESEGPALSG